MIFRHSLTDAATDLRRSFSVLTAIALAGTANTASAAENEDHAAHSPIVRAVRVATRDYVDVNAATAAGYETDGACVSGPNEGAMGVHYVNKAFIADGYIDVNRPEILVYEPSNGRLQLVAVEYFVTSDQWDAANEGPPALAGQLLHHVGAPNRLRSPAYYELHVWGWKKNRKGTFADWNPDVTCVQHEAGQAQGHVSNH